MFITFEGIDGSGKSTQSRLLADELTKRGYEVVRTREPGGTYFAEKIRDLALSGSASSKTTIYFLMMAARTEHIEDVIKPALAQGKIVICDRFVDSTYAYQVKVGAISNDLFNAVERNLDALVYPDLTILLAISAEESLKRLTLPGSDFYDNMSRLQKEELINGYGERARNDPDRFLVLNGMLHPKLLGEAVLECALPEIVSFNDRGNYWTR